LQQLHSHGLLEGAFRPKDEYCVLRGFVRRRKRLVEDQARSKQHMQKALVQMNIQLDNVVSSTTSKTGLAIIIEEKLLKIFGVDLTKIEGIASTTALVVLAEVGADFSRFASSKQEFYDIAFRKKIYASLEELQTDLDQWLMKYNEQKPHSGKYCYGKTPMQTFRESLHIAVEKNISKNQSDSSTQLTNIAE
jgi:hypothetical protein